MSAPETALATSRPSYGTYALIVAVAVAGLSGVLYFSAPDFLPAWFYLGLFLLAMGVYTVAFALLYHSAAASSERNYYLGWGYVTGGVGFAISLAPWLNPLIILSVVLIGGALLAVVALRR